MIMDELADLGLKMPSRNSAAGKEVLTHRPIMWVHISKAGGSTMCALARHNDVVVQPNDNCNWVGHDSCHLVNKGPRTNCEERSLYFQKHNFTWGQIEREFNDGDLCFGTFDYGIMLREPVDLLESLLNFLEIPEGLVDKYWHCVESKGQGNSCDGLGNGLGACDFLPWYYMDNYLVRILGGRAIYSLPVGAITTEHVEAALGTLSKFKAVLIFEDLKDNHVFENLFGWSNLPTQTHVNSHSHNIKFTQEQRGQLREFMMHDYTIYEHFSRLPLAQRAFSFARPAP